MKRSVAIIGAVLVSIWACSSSPGGSEKDTTGGQDVKTEETATGDVVQGEDTTDPGDTTQPEDTTDPEDTTQPGDTATGNIGKWGVPWDEAWPTPEQTAVYAMGMPENMVDLPVRIEYGIQFEGETWDRVTAGTPEPGNGGGVLIFDRSVPWEIRVKHLTVYYKNSPDTYGFIETFDPPTVFPLDGTTGDSLTSTGYTTIHIPGVEDPFLLTQFYTLDVLDTDASIDLAFGTVTGCLKIRATVNDDLEQPPLVVDVYIHPTLNVVYFEGAPGVALAEMVSPWE